MEFQVLELVPTAPLVHIPMGPFPVCHAATVVSDVVRLGATHAMPDFTKILPLLGCAAYVNQIHTVQSALLVHVPIVQRVCTPMLVRKTVFNAW